jgi:Domain of unknown function (DUF4157)/OmpA family
MGAIGAPRVSPALESYLSASRGAGQPVPRSVRDHFEPRFGHDFSDVRLHTDQRAARAAGGINAQAFTVGANIHFAQGRFEPGTSAGNRLLAHELTHVVQQGAGREATLQRQPSPEESPVGPLPDLPGGDIDCSIDFAAGKWRDFINCCGKSPVGRGCTKDAIDGVCKIIKCDEKPKPMVCPGGFTPGGSAQHKGQCCRTAAKNENARECCDPARIIKKATTHPICCPPGTNPNAALDKCETPPPPPTPCFPGQMTPGGECCKLPSVPRGNSCVVPPPKPPSPPPKPSPPSSLIIVFQKDKPAAGSKKALDDSLSTNGRAGFKELVTLLREHPTVKVELVGRASPEGSDEHNLALAQRRAEKVAAALADEGIDASRIANHPDGLRAECQQIRPGIQTCGEAGAIGPEDRQVLARPFLPSP